MACSNPQRATKNSFGRRRFHKSYEAAIEFIDDPHLEYSEYNCRTCLSCRAVRRRAWAIRTHHEHQMSRYRRGNAGKPVGCFLTLTYNDRHVPWDVDVSELQRFLKRLRKNHGPGIKYLGCGEYGGKTGRPHYHLCLVNFDPGDKILHKVKKSGDLYLSAAVEKLWINTETKESLGFHTVAALDYGTASYCAGYIMDKLTREQARQTGAMHPCTDPKTRKLVYDYAVKPEFNIMSRGGRKRKDGTQSHGLGHTWIERYWRDVYPRDYVSIGRNEFRPPAYYDNWMREYQPEVFEQVLEKRETFRKQRGPTTPVELRARGAIFAQKEIQKDRKQI